jgi:outer membrane protein assembly factor BamB
MSMQRTLTLTALLLASTAAISLAADWPHFAGPTRDLQSTETGLMKTWPAGGPKVLWTATVGRGFAAATVEGGKVYLLDRQKGKDILRVFDLKTGNEDWTYAYKAPGKYSMNGSRSQPAVDDKHVFTLGPMGHLHCISKTTHRPVWSVNILEKAGGKVPTWAISQTPALYKDLVIVAPDGKRAGMMAFKRKNGELAWKSRPLPGNISYASPMVTTIGGVDQVMTVTTTTTLALDPRNGNLLWQTGDWKCRIPIATPVHLGDGKVFVTGGYSAGCAMFQVGKRGGSFGVRTLFKTKESNGQIHQPILYKNHLYMNGNDKKKRDGLVCMDLKGNVKWKTAKKPGFDWGGLLMADGMIYIVDGTRGDLCIVKPDPAGYKEVARAKGLVKTDQTWAAIALSDGKLLLRDQTQLKCVDVRGR